MIEKKTATLASDDQGQGVSQGLSASLIIAAVVLAAYSMVLSSTFGIMDDYTFLSNAIAGSNDTLTLLIASGRPLNGVLLDWGFRSAGSIENLVILRAITLIGIWVLGCGLYFFSRRHCVGFISSLAIACGIILLPSFQVYASWAQHFGTPFAGTLALASAFILTPPCAIRERSRGLTILLSVLLLLTSILIYQPIAMLFCTGILISMLSLPDIVSAWKPSRVIDTALVYVTAMFLGLIVFKIGQHKYPSGSPRFGLVQNIHEKIGWFFSEPMSNALSLYLVPANATLRFVVILTGLLGAVLFIKKCGLKIASLLFIYGVLWTLGSYAPNLATAENWASYRSIGALAASVVVWLVLLLSKPMECFQRKYFWVIPVVILFILTTRTQKNVLNSFVLPNVTELNNVASLLNDEKNQQSGKVVVIIKPSSWRDTAASPRDYDEFGMPSSITIDYAKLIVEIVRRSLNVIPDAILATSTDTITNQQSDFGESLVIDFPRLVTSQRFKTAPSALLHASPNTISPLNISDDNWMNGIWVNKSNPNSYSFVYRSAFEAKQLKVGDQLKFNRSGVRTVLRVDVAGDYRNVLVDGGPLRPEDGYPRSITRSSATK